MRTRFLQRGWTRFRPNPAISAWIEAAGPIADAVLRDPEMDQWYRYGRTWFVGVNALPNDTHGAIGQGPSLQGPPVDFIRSHLGAEAVHWDRGQLSVCFPGYPQPSPDEPSESYRYRVNRDAAHVDGLHRMGPERRRILREPHAFVFGIPLVTVDSGMSPLVVWEGSHEIMRSTFAAALAGVAPQHWANINLASSYVAARRRVFETCKRVEITTQIGESYLIHRLAVHGMAPWATASGQHRNGRQIVYFRPLLPTVEDWLRMP
ncbi:MAG: hypothetical protein KDK89_09420 [Alphaproteobacteria bacterium]|nr:hypothetical protein [Alphaproteobacteria bacterium]